jgi:hypothetical protein
MFSLLALLSTLVPFPKIGDYVWVVGATRHGVCSPANLSSVLCAGAPKKVAVISAV